MEKEQSYMAYSSFGYGLTFRIGSVHKLVKRLLWVIPNNNFLLDRAKQEELGLYTNSNCVSLSEAKSPVLLAKSEILRRFAAQNDMPKVFSRALKHFRN